MITIKFLKEVSGEVGIKVSGKIHDSYLSDEHLLNLGIIIGDEYCVSDKPMKDALVLYLDWCGGHETFYVADMADTGEFEKTFPFCTKKLEGYFGGNVPEKIYYKPKK